MPLINGDKTNSLLFLQCEMASQENSSGVENDTLIIPLFDNDPHILENSYVRITLILLYTITFIFCFFGNLAVILVVTLHWRMRSITKFCLGNMAFADLSVGIFCVYQNLSTYLFDSWLFGEFMCKMYHFISSLCYTASILVLVVVSIERYLVLLHSFKSRQMITKRNLVATIVGVWLLAAVISLPRLFYFGLLRIDLSDSHSGEICVPLKSMYNSATADTAYFILLYVIPLGIITVLYARIACYLRRSGDAFKTEDLNSSLRSISGQPNPTLSINGGMNEIGLNASSSTTTNSPANSNCREPGRSAENGDDEYSGVGNTSTSGSLNAGKDEYTAAATRNGSEYNNGLSPDHTVSMVTPNKEGQQDRNQPPAREIYTRSYRQIHVSDIRERERHSVVRMLIVIVMTFAVLNLPFHVRKLCINYLTSFDMSSDINNLFAPLTFLLMYSNCAINPVLYAFLSRHFRDSFWDLAHCRRRRRPYAAVNPNLP